MHFKPSATLLLVLSVTLFSGVFFMKPTDNVDAQEPPMGSSTARSPKAVGTAFTYQGRLTDGGSPANGAYDLQMSLYSAETGGTQLGSTLTLQDVLVSDGLFTVSLDFGSGVFNGNPRYLEIGIRLGNETGAYTTLVPRRSITPAPHAIYAETASRLSAPDGDPLNAIYVDNAGNSHVTGSDNNGTSAALRITTGGQNMYFDGNEIDSTHGLFLNHNNNTNVILATGGGNVGLNTPNPNTILHINGTGLDNNGLTGVVRIVSGNGAQNLLLDGNEIDATADGLFLNNNTDENVILANGGGKVGVGVANPQSTLDVNGTTRTQILQITGGSDLAEPFEVAGTDDVEPGMIVAIDPDTPGQLRLADKAYDRAVAGAISGAGGINPGLTLQQTDTLADGDYPVALTGRIYIWADATYGAIQPGDLLTTSDTLGHAMKVSDYARAQGAVLGKAMSALDEGRGLVLVLVSLQ